VQPPVNSLITGYVVMIDDGLDGSFTVAYNGRSNPSQTYATIEDLTQRTTYRLKVYATNKSGNGEESDVITCYTVTVPGEPGKPQLVLSSASSIELSWAPAYDDGGSPIKSYTVEMDEVEGLDVANQEVWTVVFNGQALSCSVTQGLTAKS
jgi:hypothetical protein